MSSFVQVVISQNELKRSVVWKMNHLKVGDKSLIIHKSAYHLFSLLISKRSFPSLQTRKTFGEIMSGNYRFLIPVIRVMAHNCEFPLNFRLLRNISIVITNKRLVLLLPIGSNYVEMINTPATKLLILISFRYVKNN